MSKTDEKLISWLNLLIVVCNDGKLGFNTAAKNATSDDLKTLFYSLSVDREQFGNALKFEVRKIDGDPEKSGGALGALHRAWMDVKTALTSNDDIAILNACITGENAALNAYKEVLEKALLPADTRNVVAIQRIRVEESLKKIREMLKGLNKA